MAKERKPTSVRLDDEDFARLNEICTRTENSRDKIVAYAVRLLYLKVQEEGLGYLLDHLSPEAMAKAQAHFNRARLNEEAPKKRHG